MSLYSKCNTAHGYINKYPTNNDAVQNYADYVLKRLDRNRMILNGDRFDEFKQDTAEEIAIATVREVEKAFQNFHVNINT